MNDPGCHVTDHGPCRLGLHIDEHLLVDGEWRHPGEGYTYRDEDVA